MSWRYQDLTEEDKNKIGWPLPEDWEYGGEPGDKIWPVFTCPICGSKCESEWGGCSHLMLIYIRSGEGFYDYLEPAFVEKIKVIIGHKYGDNNHKDDDIFPDYERIPIGNYDHEVTALDLIPTLMIIQFNGSYSFYDFVVDAAFLDLDD